MTLLPLKFLSEAKLLELRKNVTSNLPRYTDGDFNDLAQDNGWAVESPDVQIDVDALSALDVNERTAEADIHNSMIVYKAFKGMSPALAREERVWARLTHIECLKYSRARWITGVNVAKLERAISSHMFAPGLTGVRDDNAVSRLWWNMHIASIADPVDAEGALRLLAQRADIRMQFVERSFTAGRRPLAMAVVRAMRRDPWLTSTDEAFRAFMKALNRDGGGVLFEVVSAAEADRVLDACGRRAKASLGGDGHADAA